MPEQNEVFSVSELNNMVKLLLEDQFPLIWVEGEISNFSAPHSGHWYFSLKDSKAQVRCAMFRQSQRRLNFIPKDGMHIMIRARVSLYENRGDFQLIAEDMEERGEGKLLRAFEALKKKLDDAGLFADINKKLLPSYPKQIGVITSATGAAVRDILTVLKRRAPSIPVVIYPTLVQGSTAAPTIVRAIEVANERDECDVIILARGGGSLEDLWPFNEEIVAHAIFKSRIPIISGVGHEVDFTIADFVADVRAPTPSAAAEIASKDQLDLTLRLDQFQAQLTRYILQNLNRHKEKLNWMQKHLTQQHPKRRLLEQAQRLDMCEMSLVNLITRRIELQKSRLANAGAKLDALSPLSTLQRGYAIVTDDENNVLRDAASVAIGDKVNVRLLQGQLKCVVKETA